jgi:hypothetical protein
MDSFLLPPVEEGSGSDPEEFWIETKLLKKLVSIFFNRTLKQVVFCYSILCYFFQNKVYSMLLLG